jgi:hypothetical protein
MWESVQILLHVYPKPFEAKKLTLNCRCKTIPMPIQSAERTYMGPECTTCGFLDLGTDEGEY